MEVGHFFAEANVAHGDVELVGDADDDAAFGGAVEFGEGESVDVGGL